MALFDVSVQGRLEAGWSAGCIRQRTRSIASGPILEVECYPIWDTRTALEARRELARSEAHREAQRRLDEKNARKRLERLVNANFGAGDVIFTAEYPPGRQPPDARAAARDMRNFVRRLRCARGKRGLPPLRYVYTTEETRSDKYGTRYHHHAILSGDGMTREEVEAVWLERHGGFCNTRRAQPQRDHLSGIAHYMAMDKTGREREKNARGPQRRAGARRWAASRGLQKPAETVADKKISVRKAGEIAQAAEENAKAIFGRLYPGAELIEVSAKRSAWAAGVYVYAKMRRPPGKTAVEMWTSHERSETDEGDTRAHGERLRGDRRGDRRGACADAAAGHRRGRGDL